MGRAVGEHPKMVEDITRWVVEVANAPVVIKITPNAAYADEISKAALRGGAKGVCLTNTMPSFMDPDPTGVPWPSVGEKQNVAYGGATGSVLRPYALKKSSEVAKTVPELDIFGSGGIVSSHHAMAFLRLKLFIIKH